MFRAVKIGVFILILFAVASLGLAGFLLLEKKELEQQKTMVESQLDEAEDRSRDYLRQVKDLKQKVEDLNTEKTELEERIQDSLNQAQQLNSQIAELRRERERLDSRLSVAVQENDRFSNKVRELEKELEKASSAQGTGDQPGKAGGLSIPEDVSDEYWAGILREKAALQVELDQIKKELSDKSVEIVDLREKNVDLQLRVDKLTTYKEDIDREINYRVGMINNLSIELARSKNDNKFLTSRLERITQENIQFRDQLKKLVSSKGALEKTIVQLNREKHQSQFDLEKTEALIQNKIDEIWSIKNSLDETLSTGGSEFSGGRTGSVDLPPIIISPNGKHSGGVPSAGHAAPFPSEDPASGLSGKIVSINPEYNFAIVDLGEKSGIKLGDVLNVYRDSKYIARLEVIQIRKDISAADIKDRWSEIQPGDAVR